MARKEIITHEFTSDLSGVALENDGWSSVKFTVTVDDNPQTYGMADLSIDEREELLAMLAPYFEAAKRAGNYAEGKAKPAAGSNESLQVIRRWAESVTPEIASTGTFATYTLTVGDKVLKLERPATRGRLSQEWKDAYAWVQEHSEKVDAEQAAKDAQLADTADDAKAEQNESERLAETVETTTPEFSDAKPGPVKAAKGK